MGIGKVAVGEESARARPMTAGGSGVVGAGGGWGAVGGGGV
jgi:hypothetical protein